MGFLEGSKSVSTSIGGSTQTINFTPVLNARGATSGGTVGGVTQNQTPTVTTTQAPGAGGGNGQGGESGGLLPGLSLSSSRPVEAISTGNPNYLSQSDRSFSPARLAAPEAGAPATSMPMPWLPIVLLVGLAIYFTR